MFIVTFSFGDLSRPTNRGYRSPMRWLIVIVGCLLPVSAPAQTLDRERAASAAAQSFGGTCGDVEALRKLASDSSDPAVRSIYETAAEERIEAAFRLPNELVDTIEKAYSESWFSEGDKPDGSHSTSKDPTIVIAKVKSSIARFNCLSVDRTALVLERLEQVAKQIELLRAAEVACRKNQLCFAKRYASPICELLDERDLLQMSIKEERANPSGVVDLAKLHELGAALQSTNVQLKVAQSAYSKRARKQFPRAICAQLDEVTLEASP
jgi:hypothetical protein